jgi:hypothetical protein
MVRAIFQSRFGGIFFGIFKKFVGCCISTTRGWVWDFEKYLESVQNSVHGNYAVLRHKGVVGIWWGQTDPKTLGKPHHS